MELVCPDCHATLETSDNGAHCPSCQHDFVLSPRCPECHGPLEVLRACGAVDYFCQAGGHGMISKKRVEFVPVTP